MAATRGLRAVKVGDTAGPTTILEAANLGDRLGELRAMRRRIAAALDDPKCPPRDLASLSRRQVEIGREIEAMVLAQKAEDEGGSVPDEPFDQAAL